MPESSPETITVATARPPSWAERAKGFIQEKIIDVHPPHAHDGRRLDRITRLAEGPEDAVVTRLARRLKPTIDRHAYRLGVAQTVGEVTVVVAAVTGGGLLLHKKFPARVHEKPATGPYYAEKFGEVPIDLIYNHADARAPLTRETVSGPRGYGETFDAVKGPKKPYPLRPQDRENFLRTTGTLYAFLAYVEKGTIPPEVYRHSWTRKFLLTQLRTFIESRYQKGYLDRRSGWYIMMTEVFEALYRRKNESNQSIAGRSISFIDGLQDVEKARGTFDDISQAGS